MKRSEAKAIFLSLLPANGNKIPYEQFRESWPKADVMGLKDHWGDVRRSGAVAVEFVRDEDNHLSMLVGLPVQAPEVKTS